MPSFPGVDFLRIDSLFSQQELLVRQTARQFVDQQVLPVIRDCFREARFPRELIPEMGRLGFFGANLEGYGCAGMSNVEYGLLMQEIERGDSGPSRSFVSGARRNLVMYPILTFGSNEQKRHWLPQLQSGEATGCFGLTEPGFGSNPAGMLTRARRDGWILDGEKTWITNGSVADVAVAWARTKEGVRGFLVERGTPGFTPSQEISREALHARFGHFQPGVPRLPRAGDRSAAGRQGTQSRAQLPFASPLRDRLGRHWRGHGLL